MASLTLNTASFNRSADLQLSSRFFTLPAEIRNLIYLEFWKLNCARQHIVKHELPEDDHPQGFTEQWSHVPCITDPSAPDTRWPQYADSQPASEERQVWGKRLKSEWCLHWACEEQAGDAAKSTGWIALKKVKRPGEGNEHADDEFETYPIPPGLGSALLKRSGNLPHWTMEKGFGQSGRKTKAGPMSVLTTCKRMYLEALPSLYANTTFIFTDTRTAVDFLTRYTTSSSSNPSQHPIRSVEICIRVTNLITEIYYPPTDPHGNGNGTDTGPPAIFAGRARPALSMTHNPWQQLCDALVALPSLHNLHVWLDSSDLRPWHKRVSETRFLGRLFDVRGPAPERFVLSLPELPERRGPDTHVLGGQYLEGERLEGAPFTVERGPRPNNGGCI
ncbi:hypothetical protein F5144DRAFT_603017 [Chaetomium tenue]|uniref:Uncharacterized protein n=1 Tax=Chaetomium tenue TaxID=1854479 RepID=A0ACB7PAW7_9PEZI|nr:hypothetical protein F5144DRAFT_603017 [Chaetomium globosum]